MTLVSVTTHEYVRTVRLEQTMERNPLSTPMLGALLDALGDAVDPDDARAVILTAAGQTFSVGAGTASHYTPDERRRMELLSELVEAVATCPLPTIAAVSGPCLDGAADIVAACDIRVADATATFRFAGVAMGYPLGAAKLVGLVGLGAAKDLVLSARLVAAEEAAQIGLVQHLVADGTAVATARERATEIAGNDPDTVRYLKRLFDRFSGLSDRVGVEADAVRSLAEAGGDYGALQRPGGGVGAWAGGNGRGR